MASIGGYSILALPMRIPPDFYRFLFIRRHVAKKVLTGQADENLDSISTLPTLFIANIPYDLDKDNLHFLFEPRCGTIAEVVIGSFHGKNSQASLKGSVEPNSRYAHIRFNKEKSITRAFAWAEKSCRNISLSIGSTKVSRSTKTLSLVNSDSSDSDFDDSEELIEPPSHPDDRVTCIHKWQHAFYKYRPPLEAIQSDVDTYMVEFERREEEEKSEADIAREKMDDDGFTMVVPKKAKKIQKRLAKIEELNDTSRGKGRGKKKSAKKADILPDFYKFQSRENKREQIMRLRAKFEEDKERIAKMKAERKFRPY